MAPEPENLRARIDRLITELADHHGARRRGAREALVELGRPAIGPLRTAMESPVWEIRWGATKALAQLHAPVAEAYVARLEDERSGVRWLAADALVDLGRDGLHAVLRALIERAGSYRFRDSAHHVLHDMAERDPELQEALAPVAAALNRADAAVMAPGAARTALQMLGA